MDGFWKRLGLGFRCFVAIVFRGEIPDELREMIKPAGAAKTVAATAGSGAAKPVAGASGAGAAQGREAARAASETSDRAVQMLALLQRDGRLIDFLAENISAYPDAQVGAAVRTIHESCRKVLDQYLKLEPILNSDEDQPVTLQAGFEPAAIKLIGNVRGELPVRGVLRHKGWRVKEINLPPLPQGGRMVVAAAEVEVP